MLPGSDQARTIARCGFDWVLVDTEHGNIDGKKSTRQMRFRSWREKAFQALTSTLPR